MLKPILAAAVLSFAAVSPAAAQTAITVPANSSWKHAQTGVVLRSTLAGLPRGEIRDSSASELDVMVQYGENDPTGVTVYLFRPAVGGAAIWFERAETQILTRELFRNAAPQGPARAFAPPRGSAASALRRVYVPAGGAYKATAVAMMPLGEWLVAIRISSQQLDAAALDAKLSEVIAGLGWPEGAAESAAAAPILACATPLTYARDAKLNQPDMTDALLGAMIAGVAAGKAREAPQGATPVSWCREGDANQRFGVYRGADSTDGYVMALGDAGRAITINRGIAIDKKVAPYQLSLQDLDRTLVYPTFDKLPRPDAAFEAVMKNRPVSSSARGGKNINITVPK
ncbi:MAG TPA: hypothetical protein VM662_06165 [Sphingomonas sp.]|nr:hypothetical protein [Sphingomonas sp.]